MFSFLSLFHLPQSTLMGSYRTHLHTSWELGIEGGILASFSERLSHILFFSLLFSLFRWYRAGQRVSWLSRNQLRNEIPITSFHAETTNLYNSWTIFFIYLYFRKGSTFHGWEAQSLSLCTVHPKWPSSTFSPLALLYWQRWKQRW